MLPDKLHFSGRFAAFFLDSRLTPLLVLIALLMGGFALMVTPREEEPQVKVTLADVMIPFPGASVRDVEQMVVNPAEQILSRIPNVEHVASVARPGMAIVTIQFRVGSNKTDNLVRLYDTIESHSDWIPKGLGIQTPIVKPKDVDDVPALGLTLYSRNPAITPTDLERVAHSIEVELKRVPGTREVTTIGGPGRAVMIEIDPARLQANNITVADISRAVQSANAGLPVGDLLSGNRSVTLEAGNFFANAEDVGKLIVGVHAGKPVFLREVAAIRDGPPPPSHYVWHAVIPGHQPGASDTDKKSGVREYPAVTITVTKKTGENVIDVVDALLKRTDQLRNTVIPRDVEVDVTRDLGITASDKFALLMEKLMLVTASVVALIFVALGRREAAITFFVIVFTLAMTLFSAWALGFTLNRASLFGLIVSIGILVDDAIVVIENIHRHQLLNPGKSLHELIPVAVDEIGGPTILATFTVIAALMPMIFVTGLQGDYFRPIPVFTNLGMIMSLLIALAVTPWLAMLWMRPPVTDAAHVSKPSIAARLAPLFTRFYAPLLDDKHGTYYQIVLALIILVAMITALAMPVFRIVNINLQPLDNKSDFEVMLDMPVGTTLEQTDAVLHEMAAYLAQQPEVINYQIYSGTAGPVGFTGLLRQYYLRNSSELGEIQVNLVDKHHREKRSRTLVVGVRPELFRIAKHYGANIRIFDPPAGVPKLATITAEIYGPTQEGRYQVAKDVRAVFEKTSGIVDVADTGIAAAPRKVLLIDRQKAGLHGISQQDIVTTLRSGLSGDEMAYLHDASKYPAPARLQLSANLHGDLNALLQLAVRGANGELVPLSELVTVSDAKTQILREQPIIHKDLLPVHFVFGDYDASISSPILGMSLIRPGFESIVTPGGGRLGEYFTHVPEDNYREYSLKWDGDWEFTFATFRDLSGAYIVGLILIYLLIVSQFSSYLTPLIIMVPIPFTIIGLMYGHALLRTEFTVTSLIGLMVLAGLLVRNSILLVDFVNHRTAAGMPFKEAVVQSANVRAQPIILTSLSAMLAALFLLDDPSFNGLAVALIFGNLVSTALTLVVIPTLYYALYRNKLERTAAG